MIACAVTLTAACLLAVACSKRPPVVIPGSTDVAISKIEIVGADGAKLQAETKILFDTLGLRVGSLLRPERSFNQFRLNEDRRRVETNFHLQGFFDATVIEPTVERSDAGVSVRWTVNEGERYRIGSVNLVSAPTEHEVTLRSMIPFGPGDKIEVLKYRPLRRALAERLQDEGFGHARVFSRTWLDRQAKTAAWYYFVDAGPKTTIGTMTVEGNIAIPETVIRDRIGLASNKPFSTKAARRAETTLLDTGAFRSVVVLSDADILKGPPQWPNTGGTLSETQISDDGDLVPRELDSVVNVRVIVVEAPKRQMRLEAGAEIDPFRADVFAGAQTTFRSLGGGQNHVLLRGDIGYGWRLNDPSDPTGLYGQALARVVRAGLIHPRLDAKLSARYEHTLFPSGSVRDISVGPGVRSVITDGVFFDLDLLFAHSEELDFDGLDEATRMGLSLATDSTSSGARGLASLIIDRRNDRVEASAGTFASASVEVSPGGSLSTNRYARTTLEARQFVKLGESLSLGFRGRGSWIGFDQSDGVPLGARLFGGGAYGFRGFGRQELATAVCADPAAADCDEVIVGGLSLAEATAEARFLPFRGLYGAAAFFDIGGVGLGGNPFEDGVFGAVGLGLRARSFWVPVSIDVAYRLLEESELVGPGALDRWSLFFRIGEAF